MSGIVSEPSIVIVSHISKYYRVALVVVLEDAILAATARDDGGCFTNFADESAATPRYPFTSSKVPNPMAEKAPLHKTRDPAPA